MCKSKISLVSPESSALLAGIHQKTFFSPSHQAAVTVFNLGVFQGLAKLTEIKSDEEALYWWMEFQYQQGRTL